MGSQWDKATWPIANAELAKALKLRTWSSERPVELTRRTALLALVLLVLVGYGTLSRRRGARPRNQASPTLCADRVDLETDALVLLPGAPCFLAIALNFVAASGRSSGGVVEVEDLVDCMRAHPPTNPKSTRATAMAFIGQFLLCKFARRRERLLERFCRRLDITDRQSAGSRDPEPILDLSPTEFDRTSARSVGLALSIGSRRLEQSHQSGRSGNSEAKLRRAADTPESRSRPCISSLYCTSTTARDSTYTTPPACSHSSGCTRPFSA